MVRVQRSVCGLVDKCLFKNSLGEIEVTLSHMDQEIVVTATKRFYAFMDPHRGHGCSECLRNTADHDGVFLSLNPSGFDAAKLRIHLDFGTQTITELRVEQVRLQLNKSIRAPIEHRTDTLPI